MEILKYLGRGRPFEKSPSKSTTKKTPEKKPTSRKPEVKKGKPTRIEKPQAKKTDKTEIAPKTGTSKNRRVSRRAKIGTAIGGVGILAGMAAVLALKGNIFDNNGSDGSSTTTTSKPLAGATNGTSTTTTIADTTTAATTTTTAPENMTTTDALQNSEYPGLVVTHDISPEALAFLQDWPKTAEEAAQRFGGDASQWMRNSEWPSTRTISNPNLGVFNYENFEWNPTDPENLPFDWPKTAEEAAEYFFPGQNIDPIFIQPAWIDQETEITTGWHLDEDHWLFGSEADVTLSLHKNEVAEGYTVNGTLDPVDDRNWVAFGDFENGDYLMITLPAKGQGMTIWIPGTDPNAIALRIELFVGADTPFYKGPSGKQLGPIANFPTVYPAPKNNG